MERFDSNLEMIGFQMSFEMDDKNDNMKRIGTQQIPFVLGVHNKENAMLYN